MVGLLDTSSNKMISPSSISHMVSIQHHVFHTASHMDDGMNISCMAMQGNMSKQVKSIMVRVEKQEMTEMFVEERIGMIPILIISAVLVTLFSSIFIVIAIMVWKIRQRKTIKVDLNDIKCVNDTKLKHSSVSTEEDNLKERFLDLYPADCHNKSMSSEASAKFSDSDTDRNDTRSGSSDTV